MGLNRARSSWTSTLASVLVAAPCVRLGLLALLLLLFAAEPGGLLPAVSVPAATEVADDRVLRVTLEDAGTCGAFPAKVACVLGGAARALGLALGALGLKVLRPPDDILRDMVYHIRPSSSALGDLRELYTRWLFLGRQFEAFRAGP